MSKLKPCIKSYLFLKSLREVLTYRQPPTTGGFLDKLMPEGRGKLFFKKMSCGRKKKSWKKKLGNFHGPFFESNCNPGQEEGLTIWWGSCNPRSFEGEFSIPTKIMGGGHCVLKWGFMWKYPGNQDDTFK